MNLLATIRRLACVCLLAFPAVAVAAEVVALITHLNGKVGRIAVGGNPTLQAFEKLKAGDMLTLEKDASIRLVFFASRRQESWQGAGRLEIGSDRATGTGLPEPQVRILPEIMVKQIAKTPAADGQGRAGAVRLRSIAMAQDVDKLEAEYKRLRAEAPADDLNPEIFLLAGLFDKGEYARVESQLENLKTNHPNSTEVPVLMSLYKKAIANKQQH